MALLAMARSPTQGTRTSYEATKCTVYSKWNGFDSSSMGNGAYGDLQRTGIHLKRPTERPNEDLFQKAAPAAKNEHEDV